VGAPLLSDAQTGPGGLGIAGGRWACQVAARTPPLRTLTPQVAARASRPHRHLKGPRRWPFQATTRGVLRP